jgi:hypothetical protein
MPDCLPTDEINRRVTVLVKLKESVAAADADQNPQVSPFHNDDTPEY